MHVDNPFKSPTCISICSGILGLERGLKRAIGEFRTACYVEAEAMAIYNLVTQMEKGVLDPSIVWSDIKNFPAEFFSGKIHGITAGYPCPGESTAGLRGLWKDPRFIWPYLEKSIIAINPIFLFLENVEGHISGSFPIIHRRLRALGYRVEIGIFSAEEVGAPHERRRLFILAVANSYVNYELSRRLPIGKKQKVTNTADGGIEVANPDTDESRRKSRKTSGKGKANEVKAQKRKRGRDGSAGGSEIVGDTDGTGHEGDYVCQQRGVGGFGQSGPVLENTYWIRNRGWRHAEYVESGEIQIERSSVMADTGFDPQQIQVEREYTKLEIISIAREAGITLWPAGQGDYQYPWEEPRTVEPGVGSTVNGYSFRDDILRLLGNSVVEQTAEVAFRVLMHKHGLSHLIE